MSEYLVQTPHSIGISIPNIVPNSADLDDAELVVASQGGNQDAFAQLVQRHQRRVFNLVFRMLQQYEEANEVTQDTFLAAWQGLSSFRGDSRFSTWLYRIAYNCCLKQLEQRKKDKALHAAIQAEHILDHADKEERTSTALEIHDYQNLVREQLSMLPAKYRIVLV